ncbi:MAG: efflux RND transporter periplasmic adaptor subunit [Chthoniobacteraceae bacterium]
MKTKTFIQIIVIMALLAGAVFVGSKILKIEPPAPDDPHGHGHGGHAGHGHDEEPVKGPKGGRLLGDDHFQTEVTIYEPAGLDPYFRLYFYEDGKGLDPAGIDATIELHRINRTDTITFEKQGMFLSGAEPVVEPHSFEARVEVVRSGQTYDWSYESLEGRVEMSEEARKKAGIGIETAGPAQLSIKLDLNGKITPNEEQLTHVIPRFPGVIKAVKKKLGDRVETGDVLAVVESNESLQTYEIRAEMAGTVIRKEVTLGEFVSGQEPIFAVADLSTVWADFSVYPQDFPLLRKGQTVVLEGGSGTEKVEAKIDYISPFGSENSQTMLARATVPNANGEWRPGLFVRGSVITDQAEVPVAVKAGALQTFRDWDVVFIRVGELFEAVSVELGRRDDEWIEVKSGLAAGDQYAAENSFVVKADIGKAGASHDH